MNAITLENLSKTYLGGKTAVNDVSLCLPKGEIFGFLGPNGAGKTTTVKLLTGMLTPTRGRCSVLGLDPAREPVKVHALSGVVTEHAQMYDSLTGRQNLTFYGSVFGLGPAESKRRAAALLEQMDLTAAADQKLAAYSTGMRQRLSLARALIHKPQILFLDEPTSGLDPESAQNVHALIRRLACEDGITVFLCTHQLRYAQEICTCYGLMDEGRLLASGTLEALRHQTGKPMMLTIRASGNVPTSVYRQTGDCLYEAPIPSEEAIPPMVHRLVDAGCQVYHVSASLPTLEDIYFALTAARKEIC